MQRRRFEEVTWLLAACLVHAEKYRARRGDVLDNGSEGSEEQEVYRPFAITQKSVWPKAPDAEPLEHGFSNRGLPRARELGALDTE